MSDRRNNVEQPHVNICRWILDLNEYQCWKAQPRGLLWIKGKPGAGKSRLMSFLYHRLREQRRTEHGVHLDFSFSTRGTDMQRTPLGMLRSLLNQIFCHDASIRPPVRELYTEKCTAFGRGERSWEWQRRELEALLAQAILTSAQQQQVTVFIDALDEAGEESARDTARYFHHINDRVASASAAAKSCISCRQYPIPSTVRGAEVWVEKHNGRAVSAPLSCEKSWALVPQSPISRQQSPHRLEVPAYDIVSHDVELHRSDSASQYSHFDSQYTVETYLASRLA